MQCIGRDKSSKQSAFRGTYDIALYVKDSELLKGQFFNNDFSQETEIFSQGHLGHQTPQGIISQF